MSEGKTPYDAPIMSLEVRSAATGAFSWSLEIASSDVTGEKILGYKAKGDDLAISAGDGVIVLKVHDELRDVWTEMPANHRMDVRLAMQKLLSDALVSLKTVSK